MIGKLLLFLLCQPNGFASADKAIQSLISQTFRIDSVDAAVDILSRTRTVSEPTRKSLESGSWICEADALNEKLNQFGIKYLSIFDSDFPLSLQDIADPPPLFFYQGFLPHPTSPKLGVVGSRKATPVGYQTSFEISKELASSGVAIISGLAEGIDTAAHEGALDGNGYTLAILGNGLKKQFPASNTRLRRRILESGGGIFSEFPPDMPALHYHFPRRNRLISGYSDGTLIVEASLKSGSLITATYALDQGKDLFSVPGSVRSAVSEGTNRLLKDGAIPVTSASDILEYYTLQSRTISAPKAKQMPSLSPEEQSIISTLLREGPSSFDVLASQLGLSAPKMLVLLTSLELNGCIEQLITGEYKPL